MKKIITYFILIGLISVTGCFHNNINKDWYLIGSKNIKLTLDFNNKMFTLFQGKQLLFQAKIIKQTKKKDARQLHLNITSINPKIKEKYTKTKDFIVWLYFLKDKRLKLLMNSFYQGSYYFSPTYQNYLSNDMRGETLSDEEQKNNPITGVSSSNLLSHYRIDIETSSSPQLDPDKVVKLEQTGYRKWLRTLYKVPEDFDIARMSDYLKDSDPSTAFITKGSASKLTLNYFLQDKIKDIPLSQGALIRGVSITCGNLLNKSEYRKYRRPKHITIYFGDDYTGGLGFDKSNFNEAKYQITLPDEEKPYTYAFLTPIQAKVISIDVDSYYIGERNELAIYDLVFFSDTN
jgi:hypothetical protein